MDLWFSSSIFVQNNAAIWQLNAAEKYLNYDVIIYVCIVVRD